MRALPPRNPWYSSTCRKRGKKDCRNQREWKPQEENRPQNQLRSAHIDSQRTEVTITWPAWVCARSSASMLFPVCRKSRPTVGHCTFLNHKNEFSILRKRKCIFGIILIISFLILVKVRILFLSLIFPS